MAVTIPEMIMPMELPCRCCVGDDPGGGNLPHKSWKSEPGSGSSLFRRRRGRSSTGLGTARGSRLLFLDPGPMMVTSPGEIDPAGSHGVECALHAEDRKSTRLNSRH